MLRPGITHLLSALSYIAKYTCPPLLRSSGPRLGHARAHSGDWDRRLESACSTEEVVSLSREFMSQWSAAQLAMLPRLCRPRMLGDIDDLMLYACVLEEEEQRLGRLNAILGSITAFFAAASSRLPALVAMASSPRGRISAAG